MTCDYCGHDDKKNITIFDVYTDICIKLFQNLAAEKTYNNLNVTLKKANEHRNAWFEGVQKCTLDETLFDVLEKIVKAEVTYFFHFYLHNYLMYFKK